MLIKTYFKASKLMTEKADAEENLEDVMEARTRRPQWRQILRAFFDMCSVAGGEKSQRVNQVQPSAEEVCRHNPQESKLNRIQTTKTPQYHGASDGLIGWSVLQSVRLTIKRRWDGTWTTMRTLMTNRTHTPARGAWWSFTNRCVEMWSGWKSSLTNIPPNCFDCLHQAWGKTTQWAIAGYYVYFLFFWPNFNCLLCLFLHQFWHS